MRFKDVDFEKGDSIIYNEHCYATGEDFHNSLKSKFVKW